MKKSKLAKSLLHELQSALGKPVKRSIFTFFFAFVWFLLATEFLLNYLPQTNFYNVLLSNAGLTAFDVYLFWTWIPIPIIFILGMLWASGLLEILWGWLNN
jgi:hypothetical protein